MTPDVLITAAQGGAGALVVLAFVVVAFIRGWIVPGYVYQETLTEKTYWRSIADRALTTAERIVPALNRQQGGGS